MMVRAPVARHGPLTQLRLVPSPGSPLLPRNWVRYRTEIALSAD